VGVPLEEWFLDSNATPLASQEWWYGPRNHSDTRGVVVVWSM
jgi:hypothetical protein